MRGAMSSGCEGSMGVALAQAGDVVGERLHLRIRQPRRDLDHDAAVHVLAVLVVAALPALEGLQLRVRVVAMLAADARIVLRDAAAVRAVTRRAGGYAGLC